MALDASFEKVENVRPHPNADKLDMCEIGGYPVVIGKNQFKNGDVVFYIREDAQLTGDIQRFPWQANALKYASGSGRIKVIKLRGEFSSGLTVPVSEVYAHIKDEKSKNWEEDNKKIHSEEGVGFLLGKFGIKHFELPCPVDGDSIGPLVWTMPKSDEENFQSLSDSDIPYGEKCLVTKKLDGTSMAICCSPNGEVHICSRSLEKKIGVDNVYNRAAKEVIDPLMAWSKKFNKRIILRGECTGHDIQRMSINKDRDINGGKPTFNIYGVFMPDEYDIHNRFGRYGSDYHFLKIVEQIKELTGIELKTVPILGEEILTKDLLVSYTKKPKEWGEGVVLNFYNGIGSCKSKSLDYLGKISQEL